MKRYKMTELKKYNNTIMQTSGLFVSKESIIEFMETFLNDPDSLSVTIVKDDFRI